MSSNPATAATNGVEADLRAECDRLRRRVQELEKERDEFRKELCRLARGLFSEKELQSIPDGSDGMPLADFLGELEQIVRKS